MRRGYKIALIAFLVITTTIFHYATDPHAGTIHELLQRMYYLPVVLAGLWFGAWGGLLTAFVISVAYYPHAMIGWHGPHSSFFRLLEMVMFHVIGGLTGLLASRVERALQAERRARSEEQKASEERHAAYERLREKTQELFTLEEQLRRSDRLAALGTLSAGLAHEIRNPLSSIQTSVEILRERARQQTGSTVATEDGAPDFHGILLEETQRLDRIVTSFLEFSRQEKSLLGGEPKVARIEEALAKTAELLKAQSAKQEVVTRFTVEPASLQAQIPESYLRQVFLNLFLNSLDAMPGGGELRVHARGEEKTVQIIVEDSGPGIAANVAEKVFDPFFSTKASGTGLGLSIVDRILNSQQGSIELDRTRMPSSRFLIRLPLAPAE